MRWTRTLIPTTREDPSEAEAPSYKLMVRAGMIRKLGAGIFTFLPMGARVLHRAAELIRQEMVRSGAQELLLPVLQPPDLWQETGRGESWGEDFLRVKDGRGRTSILASAVEETILRTVRNEISSYRQLPVTLFQIQFRFHSEPRPRSGIIKAREFLMAEGFGFHASNDELGREYESWQETIKRILDRTGVAALSAEADTGPMGGPKALEFMVPTPYGDDELVRCPKCRYAANIEKAECIEIHGRLSSAPATRDPRPLQEVETPGASTVDEVARFLKVDPHQIVKTMILRVESGYVAALVRGDHSLNLSKLLKVLRLPWAELASPGEVERATGAPFGFAGPVGLPLPVVADLAIEHMQNFVTGANRLDRHYVNANQYRDFRPQTYADIRAAQVGDLCSRCMAPLEFVRTIRVGHAAQLGTRYSEAMRAVFMSEKREPRPIALGSFGVDVNRLVAAALETHNDKSGIIWPRELAPFPVLLCSINPRDEQIVKASEQIYQRLMEAGIDTLWDDRDVTPGVKFIDSDLLGLPVRLVVGNKTIKEGTVDLKLRNKPDQASVSSMRVVESVKNALKDYRL
jgi:prolyl-tRNA synthetase